MLPFNLVNYIFFLLKTNSPKPPKKLLVCYFHLDLSIFVGVMVVVTMNLEQIYKNFNIQFFEQNSGCKMVAPSNSVTKLGDKIAGRENVATHNLREKIKPHFCLKQKNTSLKYQSFLVDFHKHDMKFI